MSGKYIKAAECGLLLNNSIVFGERLSLLGIPFAW